MKEIDYYEIGLDIGTNSVGYAVTDRDGTLLKFKKKNMWGVNLFDSAQTAVSTRSFRCTRRRYERRKQRIQYLQDFLNEDICKVDDNFYLRLKQSFLWNIDKDDSICDMYTFFNDNKFDEKDYYKRFPTIYHLRRYLMTTTQQEDIRLVYLALHNIVKYRGNFLFDNVSNMSAKDSQLEPAIEQLLFYLGEYFEVEDIDKEIKTIVDIIKDINMKKKGKSDAIESILERYIDNKNVTKGISNAIVGCKTDFIKMFCIDTDEKISFSLSEDASEEKLLPFLDENQIELYEILKKVYSAFVLSEILKGENINCLSDSMIQKYDSFGKDLKSLKKIYKNYFPELFNSMFKGEKVNGCYVKTSKKNFTNYILSSKDCSREDLYKAILLDFNTKSEELKNDENYQYCIARIENETFLQKQTSTDNGAIPFQLHLEEMKLIIENQGEYYNSLLDNKDKLCSLVSFRIPYYVGPLNEKANPCNQRQFAWMTRKNQDEKIYPWNFEQVVDIDTSAESFIKRMTNKCSYLPKEDVIPKCSLLYSEYEVRNEIKQIKVDDKFLDLETQQALYNEVFTKQKNISESSLKKWLKNNRKYIFSVGRITGFQKDGQFASSLASYIDFTRIFGRVDNSNKEMIEKLILWITLFEDKKILRRKIKNEYPIITEKQLESIYKLKYTGWSRLSEKLLVGLKVNDNTGKKQCIMDIMRESSQNFMQIIRDKKYDFSKLIEQEAMIEDITKITPEIVNSLAASPEVKRGILQSSYVVEEIVQIMKCQPAAINIEFARDDQDSQRTNTRKKLLEKKFEALKNNKEFAEIVKELKKYDNKALSDKMLYLYFIQNGKSMYSGKPLNIERLSQECQIDHIVPQSYIKDDSFDNTVLVFSGENQKKTDKLIIDKDVQSDQKSFWTSLLNNGLISQKKFNNLTRPTPFDDHEMAKFINRQLVETRQIIKHVANLFQSLYKQTKIVEIKANLSSSVREQYGLYKSRQINDYHHAHDAYLATIVGRYVNICYSESKDEFNYFKFIHSFKKPEFAISKTVKNGIVAGAFGNIKVDKSTGDDLWNGPFEIERLRKCLNYKDCFISKKTEELTGDFYKQTLYPKCNDDKLIPIKAGLDVAKYGGYSSPNQSYSAIIEYDGKKGRVKKLIGIPVYIAKLENSQPDAIENYFEKNDYKNAKLLKTKICKYQKLEYEGNIFYLSSSQEVHNARQLVLDNNTNKVICKMNDYKHLNEVTDEELNNAFNCICINIKNYYPCFSSQFDKLQNCCDDFIKKSKQEKIGILNQLLVMLHANASNGNFKKYAIGKLGDREGRLAGKNLDVDKIIFINTSVTGLFSNRVYGKDL